MLFNYILGSPPVSVKFHEFISLISFLCVRLTTLPLSCAVVMKSGNLNFLEPPGLSQACNGTALHYIIFNYILGSPPISVKFHEIISLISFLFYDILDNFLHLNSVPQFFFHIVAVQSRPHTHI
jgi:hypothetical protein